MQDNLIDTLAFLLNGTYEKYVNCHEHINVIFNTKTIQSTAIVFISITFKNFISREVGKTLMPIYTNISVTNQLDCSHSKKRPRIYVCCKTQFCLGTKI